MNPKEEARGGDGGGEGARGRLGGKRLSAHRLVHTTFARAGLAARYSASAKPAGPRGLAAMTPKAPAPPQPEVFLVRWGRRR
jgi:hypothetical protein